MSSQDSPRLELDVGRRRWERRIALLALMVGAASLWAGMPAVPAYVVVSALLPIVWGLWREGWLGGRDRLCRAVWLADGRWILLDRGGRAREGWLRADSRVGAYFAWLRWDAGRTYSMLLVSGDLRASELRRLVVRLRIEGSGRTQAAVP